MESYLLLYVEKKIPCLYETMAQGLSFRATFRPVTHIEVNISHKVKWHYESKKQKQYLPCPLALI